MACNKCNKVISDAERIGCRGFCGAVFHVICAKVELPLLDVLGEYEKNVFWMCDNCSELFSNCHFRGIMDHHNEKFSALPEAMESMKSDISNLNLAIATLTEKVNSQPIAASPLVPKWPNIDRLNSANKTPKRRRGNSGLPITSSNNLTTCGTRSTNGFVKTVSLQEDLTWVYLSAFHPATKEEDIAALTRECLQLDTHSKPKVVKLVPRDKDPQSLSFVSFKVGIAKEHRDAALSCETWPEDVHFREFNDTRKKITKINEFISTHADDAGNASSSNFDPVQNMVTQ